MSPMKAYRTTWLTYLINNINRNPQNTGHDVVRRESEPLCQGDVGDAVGLVDFDPDEIFCFGEIFDVVACLFCC